jgi:hypothetical protein
MRLRTAVVFGIVAVALLLVPSSGSTVPPGFDASFWGKVLYSNGAVCAPAACEWVVVDHRTNTDRSPVTGNVYSITCACDSYPNGNRYIWINISYNAYVYPGPNWASGDYFSAYARQACPGGGFHISPTHQFQWHGVNEPWWGGQFQLGTGCVA